MRIATWTRVGFFFGLLGGVVACGDDKGSDDGGACQPGTQFCQCLGGTVCEGALVCKGGYCVQPGGTSDPSGDPSGTGGPTTDPSGTGGPTTDPTTGGPTTDPTTGGPTTDPTGTMEAGGPEIVDFGTNVTMLTEGQSVVFTATVIDPDGPDDIQGGSLKSEDGSITYGAFNDNGDGTFSLSVSWAELHQAQAIDFTGSEMRAFRAQFFDNDGKTATQQTTITFTCAGGCAADGKCPDTQNDADHCGTCGHVCEVTDDFGGCAAGKCQPHFSECVMPSDPLQKCSQVCAAQGFPGCAECGQDGLTILEYVSANDCQNFQFTSGDVQACGNVPGLSFYYYRCCCDPKN